VRGEKEKANSSAKETKVRRIKTANIYDVKAGINSSVVLRKHKLTE
jgi:hypothetical protein